MTDPTPTPAPLTLTCGACGAPPLVHWQRRLTDDELAAYIGLEQVRREEQVLLADPQQAPPAFGPLPTEADVTRAVHACGQHAIGIDAAALIHTKTCAAPPTCTCTPEEPPEPEPLPGPPQLPASWITSENGG